MSAERRPRPLAATVGRGAAPWLVMFPMPRLPVAERAAAENAHTSIAFHPGGVEHRDIHGRHGLGGVAGTVAVSTAATVCSARAKATRERRIPPQAAG